MSNTNSVVSIFANQDQAEPEINRLESGGINLERVSFVGRLM